MKRLQCSALRGALVVLVAVLAGAMAAASSVWAQASDRHHFDIPAGDLGNALTMLAQQAEREVVFPADIARGKRSVIIKGDLTTQEALDKLLANTGLSYRLNATGPVVVEVSPGPLDPSGTSAANSNQADLARRAADGLQLGEVVVTAQKRNERLQDVPLPVTVISAQSLLDSNQLKLQDYYSRVPGLNVTSDDFGTPMLAIRGLVTGPYLTPTVGIVVDDVPFGSATAFAAEAPDFDPSDLSRIEVLRGPQGTLYGASTLGGLLKYVTIDPSTAGVNGRVEAGTSTIHNGAELGYSVRGSVNVPLSDTLAIRASAFARGDPGYIDDPSLAQKGVNEEKVYGGRLSALWRPSEDFSLKLSALAQHSRLDGSPYADWNLPDLQQVRLIGSGWTDNTLQAYSATVRAKLFGADFVALSGYNVNKLANSFDDTPSLGFFTQSVFNVPGTDLRAFPTTKKFTQELRLSSIAGPSLEWLIGAYYDHEDSPNGTDILAVNPAATVVGSLLHYVSRTTYAEYAGFLDLTYHLTDRLSFEVGGRESDNRQTAAAAADGIFLTANYPKAYSKDNSFTYQVTPKFKISDDFMTYLRLSSGYRPGGPNLQLSVVEPATYKPDTTRDYEIGLKGDVLAHALTFDASLYYIDWHDIQIYLTDPVTQGSYVGNGDHARSKGVEFSVTARPMKGMDVDGWVAWNDAELTQTLPNSLTYGSPGDRLPFSSRFSASVSLEQRFPLGADLTGAVAGQLSYTGDRVGAFVSPPGSPERQQYPGYARADLRSGVTYHSWRINVYVNNLADKRGVLFGGIGTNNPSAFSYIQPRTVGLTLAKTF